ncbi:MAG: ribokinase [Lachnospiraceae bacterium]|nr:ribokinase [Lachnospiraceae bacterium]
MKDKILTVGSLNYDIFLTVSRFPEEGESMIAEEASFSSGGKGANQAVQAARLGLEVYLAGAVGKDGNGKYLKETVAGYNVNTAYIAEKDVPTGLGVVTTRRDGAVKITVLKGANFALEKADLEPLREILPEVSWMILQMEIPTEIDEALLDMAAEYDCKVVLNAAPPAPFSDEAFRKADITVFNETEALYYLGYRPETREEAYQALRDLRDRFHNDVVITLGKDGAVCLEKNADEPAFIPALPMKAVDTTGAGDSFIGGMVYALTKGKDLEEACRFASCCSAVTIQGYGAQVSMPDLEQAEALYKKL